MKGSGQTGAGGGRTALLFALLTGVWLAGWRAALDTPWGFRPEPVAGGLVNVGIVCNPDDTWSYLSWVQQYAHGSVLAGMLYTTEPHAALLWLFPLWLIGRLAAWTGLPVIGVYNGLGLLGAMTAVWLFRRAAAALRLSASAGNWATVALVLGSGGSWAWHLLHKLGWAPPADGGDLFFLDLFPSTALLAYAYHSIGLALLAGAWWSATELENRLHDRSPFRGWMAATAGFALLLGFSRPYEPLAFLAAWGLKTAWHASRRKLEPDAWRASFCVALVLGFALAPGILRTAWASTQPVWSNFAHASLALGLSRASWLATLAGWLALIALGGRFAWRHSPRSAVLPLAASLLFVVILLGLGSAQTKLASGLILGPILLAGWSAAGLIHASAKWPRFIRIGTAALGLSALFGTGSLLFNLNTLKLRGPALIDADVLNLAGQLPRPADRPPPVVLTDPATAAILPGLVGARVWAGHWAFSTDYKAHAALLQRAGLEPENRPVPTAETSAALAAVLSQAPFEFALLDRRCRPVLAELSRRGWISVSSTARWSLLRAPAAAVP